MERKTKFQKGFIQIPLLVIILFSSVIISGIGYGAFEYFKLHQALKETDRLSREEKYDKALEKLSAAKESWLIKLGFKKEVIIQKQESIKKLTEDFSKYQKGLEELTQGNYQEAINLFSQITENSYYFDKARIKIEEAKRKIIEKELEETKIAKEKAEEKAKKEELEKKLKEQQLLEKEAEERRMNADNDGDGLTYREELKLGTSDWEIDSDGDGIIDSEDAHPAGGERYIPQNFTWTYGDSEWTWTYSIHEDWYEYYKNKPRSPQGVEYITPEDPFIKEASKMLKKTAKEEGYAVTLFIGSFVQSLPYVKDAYTSFDEYPKYPIETFVERNGDCEDTSYLAASLIDAAGYGVALVILDDHMAIAIKASPNFDGYYYELDDGRYYYLETTGEGWGLGNMPKKYRDREAKIIRVWDGKVTYKYPKYQSFCKAILDFPGYYTDGTYIFSDSKCRHKTFCIRYKNFYFSLLTEKLYWDSACSQEVVIGCYKSNDYPGYFTDGIEYYIDSLCTIKARVCRPALFYSDRYWDGEDYYWDRNCTQKVIPSCYKSVLYPGLFFDGWNYYSDYRCTQRVNPY